jgi:hypothetical protein
MGSFHYPSAYIQPPIIFYSPFISATQPLRKTRKWGAIFCLCVWFNVVTESSYLWWRNWTLVTLHNLIQPRRILHRCAYTGEQAMTLLTSIGEVTGSAIGWVTDYSGYGFTWFSSVRPVKCWYSTSNKATDASLDILSNSLFMNLPTTVRYMVWVTDSVAIWATNKYLFILMKTAVVSGAIVYKVTCQMKEMRAP